MVPKSDRSYSGKVASLTPLSLLNIAVETRLYLHPFQGLGASGRLALLPFGIVVTPSSCEAWHGIVHMGDPPFSPSLLLPVTRQ